jgi:hypothetical protein
MNLEKAVNHSDTAKNKKFVFAFRRVRRVAVVKNRSLINSPWEINLWRNGYIPACTDLTTKPWVQEAGVEVLNQAFFAAGNIATAGDCLASSYLAAWVIARLEGLEVAASALHYVAPVGEKDAYVSNAFNNITPYLPQDIIANYPFKPNPLRARLNSDVRHKDDPYAMQ